jgi:hypothetical protein
MERHAMRKIPAAVYLSPSQLDERIREREAEAAKLPSFSKQHHSIVKEIAELRMYADAKRWLGELGKAQKRRRESATASWSPHLRRLRQPQAGPCGSNPVAQAHVLRLQA